MIFTCTAPGCADQARIHLSPAHLRARPPRAASKTRASVARNRKGRTLRIDIHCHYLNPEVAAKVAQLDPARHDPLVQFANALTREVNAKQMRDRAPRLSDIATRLRDMDRMGIDIQAVSPAPNQTYYWTEPDMGRELARDVNDRLAQIVAAHPGRFVALGTVPLQNVELAIGELERCVRDLGMRGVEINPSVRGMDLTDPRLDLERFFAKVQELNVLIFMHPLGFTSGERLRDHYFNNVIGNPMETTIAASHLIFDGVLQRHPRLKLVLPHAGGYLAHYWARMDHAYHARADCRTILRRPPTHYLKKMYFDTIAFDPAMLRHLVDQYGADHVLLGTDYPYDMGVEDPVGAIAGVPHLSGTERARIEGGNAARLLKIRGRK